MGNRICEGGQCKKQKLNGAIIHGILYQDACMDVRIAMRGELRGGSGVQKTMRKMSY
jgi:hypothetical protein